ncbi:MAG: exodeoxyribonuclease III [Desulfuromonadales bacterium]|nr:exodeoxyribonuclease III [Desulfuromonadales bacterium]
MPAKTAPKGNHLKIISFNVNSIRARLHQLEAVIAKHQPDLIALQETKVQDEDFPVAEVEKLGYHAAKFGQKTHYGVATLSLDRPVDIRKGFSGDGPDAQRRLLATTHALPDGQTLHLVNGYFPQGENRQHPVKFPNKAKFYAQLDEYLGEQEGAERYLAVVGDMNVAPGDGDIGIGNDNARRWLRSGKCSFLPEERKWLDKLMQRGLVDCFRSMHPDSADEFSWFDYRSRGFEREPKRGLRIDLILGSRDLADRCVASGIDYDIRAMERPSDHAPVWAEFNLG